MILMFFIEKFVNVVENMYLCNVYVFYFGLYSGFYSGLTGFDSGMRWYVSMQSNGCELYNHFGQQFNWRKQLRSRCLIEV